MIVKVTTIKIYYSNNNILHFIQFVTLLFIEILITILNEFIRFTFKFP